MQRLVRGKGSVLWKLRERAIVHEQEWGLFENGTCEAEDRMGEGRGRSSGFWLLTVDEKGKIK